MKLRSVVLLVALLALIGGNAMAQSTGGNVYTGCLNPGGQIKDVAIGSSPLQPCGPSETQISWNEPGAGDLGCSTDQIIKWDDALEQWMCSDDLALLEARIAALEDLLQNFSRVDNDIYLTGANLHVVNGMGLTGSTNGLGNLIIGYNEELPPWLTPAVRTGSHMLVVGSEHSYSSYGGIVVGRYNTTSGPYASVSGGYHNTASGNSSSVSGGDGNTASLDYASVSGGEYNTASGYSSSVSGGRYNTASGYTTSVSGGGWNTASGTYASVSGGGGNSTSNLYASVSGGLGNIASGYSSSVSGGYQNTASGGYSSVSGGSSNTASGARSSVSGGNTRSVGGDFDWRAGDLFQDQ